MNKLFVTSRRLMLLVACALGVHSTLVAQDTISYNKKELHQLIQQAKSAEDYQKLTTYFVSKENAYLVEAQTAQENYEQARHHIAVPKYPTAADTAKWFYQYDVEQADHMAKLAAQHEQKQRALNATPRITANGESTR
jgi:ethanolamine ammonia-lyase large subunit